MRTQLYTTELAISVGRSVGRTMEERRGYTTESQPMSLVRFAKSYQPCSASPQVAVVESGLPSTEQQLLADGQVFTACGTKKIQVLLAHLPSSQTVYIPVTSNTLFAMIPADDNEPDRIVCKSWEKVFTSVADIVKCTPLPPALKVMADSVDHKKRQVPLGTHLYNVAVVEKRQGLHKRKGITAVTSNGEPLTFLEGSNVRLSSQQSHTKSLLTCFYNVVKFPQRARVFQNDLEDRGLENLSEIIFTDRGDEEYLVVQVNRKGVGQEGEMNADTVVNVPLKANIKVTAVSLKKPTLPGSLSMQRPLIKSPTTSSPTDEIYLMEPISHPDASQSETTGDGDHEYQYMEPTYDMPTLPQHTEHGRSGFGKEVAVEYEYAENPPTEGVLYYNLSQTKLGQPNVQSGADDPLVLSTSKMTEPVATPPHKQKGRPPAVKPKPIQHKSMVPSLSSKMMQQQVGVTQHQAMVSQQSLDDDVVEYANFGCVKLTHRPTEEISSLPQQPSAHHHSMKSTTLPQQPSAHHHSVTTALLPQQPSAHHHSMKSATLPQQPSARHHSVRTALLPQQPASRHSAQTGSLPRQQTSPPSVNTTSAVSVSEARARSKSLVATPLTVVARGNSK